MTERDDTLEAKVKALAEAHIPAMTRFGRVTEHNHGNADVFAICGPVVDGRQAYVLVTVTGQDRQADDLDATLRKKVQIANLLMINNLREAGVEIAA